MTVARLLWEAAGRPTLSDTVAHSGPCWWCGQPNPGLARPRDCVADTFPDRNKAAVPVSGFVCQPCGWCWSDAVQLPAPQRADRIIARIASGGLTRYATTTNPTQQRNLLLPLADGRIGQWSPGESARDRKPWEAAFVSLRASPVDVGPCRYLGAVPASDILPADETTEKMRSFHHYAANNAWIPFTDSHRLQARQWLLNPPTGWWTCTIGDGKKHAVIHQNNRPSFGAPGMMQGCFFRGFMVDYLPGELARQILACERMLFAGAQSDEIETGRFLPRQSPWWSLALCTEEPLLSVIRGSPTLPLALYLTQPKSNMAEWPKDHDGATEKTDRAPTSDTRSIRCIPPEPPPATVRHDPAPALSRESVRDIQGGTGKSSRQLRLFD